MKLHIVSINPYTKVSIDFLKDKAQALLIELNKASEDDIEFSDFETKIKDKVVKFIAFSETSEIKKQLTYLYNELKSFSLFLTNVKGDKNCFTERVQLVDEISNLIVDYQIETYALSTV